MRFQLFSVAILQAANFSQAVYLEESDLMRTIEPSFEESLAQVNAMVDSENANLVEALSKVISSLNTTPPANAPSGKPEGEKKDEGKKDDGKKEEEKKPAAAPAKKSGDAGTNIAITTATDQHINIFVPEDPSGKVTVKKTDGVKIVESDSDKADKNADVKKAIGDKIKAKLVNKAIKDDDDDESSGSSDGHHKKIRGQQKKIKDAKAKSGKMKKALENAAKGSHHKKMAQTGSLAMTEEEILALTQDQDSNSFLVQNEVESEGSSNSGSESSSGSSSSSGSGSGSGSSSGSGSDSDSDSGSGSEKAQISAEEDSGAIVGMDEDGILALA